MRGQQANFWDERFEPHHNILRKLLMRVLYVALMFKLAINFRIDNQLENQCNSASAL